MKRGEAVSAERKVVAGIFGVVCMIVWLVIAHMCFDSKVDILHQKIFWFSLFFIAAAVVIGIGCLTGLFRNDIGVYFGENRGEGEEDTNPPHS